MIKGETLNPTTVYVILIDRHLSSPFQSNVIPHYFLNYSFLLLSSVQSSVFRFRKSIYVRWLSDSTEFTCVIGTVALS